MKFILAKTVLVSGLLLSSPSLLAAQKWQDKALDAWIDGKAESTLMFNTNLNSFDINTDVNQRVITLTGKVDSEIEKALAEELLLTLEQVKSVDNQLTVMADPAVTIQEKTINTLTDAKINTVVKTKLLMEQNIDGTDIKVDTTDRVVTLSGKVYSDIEHDLVLSIAQNTSDVTDVEDELIIISH
jgi:hyperosmotically inducible periplasmic protein